MTAIRDKLRDQYPRAVQKQPPEGAFVADEEATILSVDSIAAAGKQPEVSGKRCDELVVLIVGVGKTGIYAVERKGGRALLPHIREQLQGGMNFVDGFVAHHAETRGERFVFEPVWVSKSIRLSTFEARRLARGRKVTSRFSRPKAIVHIPWGEPLPPLKAA